MLTVYTSEGIVMDSLEQFPKNSIAPDHPFDNHRSRLRVLPRLLSRSEKYILALFISTAIVSGILFIGTLGDTYSVPIPAHGGTLREGIVGIPRFINPLLAISDADRDLTALIYTGLMRFDGKGNIIPSLADRFEVSEDGLEYTFFLNPDAEWSDGVNITVDDILFTISLTRNSAYRSPLKANWEGVTVQKINEHTVRFILAQPYAPFLENATMGILPRHIWNNINSEEFHLSEFNLSPIGAGPYKVGSFEKNNSGRITIYQLESNKNYLPAEPFIENLELHFFTSMVSMQQALETGSIDSASAPSIQILSKDRASWIRKEFSLPRVFSVFFNQEYSEILTDTTVRKALEMATNKPLLVKEVLGGYGAPAYSPIPPKTFGSLDKSFYQDHVFDIEKAKIILEEANWTDLDEDGIRENIIRDEEVKLSFTLNTSNAPELIETARLLQSMWKQVGIEVNLAIYEIGDFEQNILRTRSYDAVLFGQVVGHDPDPFAFWHSSQKDDPGINIALYGNSKTDELLEKAREELDESKRKKQYEEFQKLVVEDNPALFLYSPYYVYVSFNSVQNMQTDTIVLPSDRFSDIHTWYIQTKKIWNIL